MAFIDFLVTPSWLQNRFETAATDIRAVDGTWVMPGGDSDLAKGCIPGACFFDLDTIAKPDPVLKHMLPSQKMFEDFNEAHGIKPDDHVVCYDRHGMFSAPRLWWTYRMFGHEKVSVLNGGLPGWLASDYPYNLDFGPESNRSEYTSSAPLSGIIGFDALKSLLGKGIQIIDARPGGRFTGETPEPRAGLKSGHIPGSKSLPFGSLISEGLYKPLGDIAETVGKAGVDLTKPIITTCGSGITATGLALIFHQLGASDVRVYDGSWAEWGASTAPIEI